MTTRTVSIKSYDVYENSRIKLSSLLKYMQQIAREDSDSYGATYPAMRADNMVFVITKLAIKFDADVYEGDTLEISTSSHSIEGVTFERRFNGIRNGERVFTASTDWVLIDFTTRSILRPSALRFPIAAEHSMECEVEVKRRIPMPVCDKPNSHIVRYTELDENRHLNNTVYADILFDNLPTEVPDKRIDTCYLNFVGEATLGEELTVYAEYKDGIYRSSALNSSNGKQCYTAELKFFGDING